ncbi:SH3 domain-containing protein [Arcobacter sp. YIC-464]|uniref:SH3 domain-containing protein n=1 Tax=Arcobacter sp. YIC-464 TaxID=3376631 RepID=UPI003C221310
MRTTILNILSTVLIATLFTACASKDIEKIELTDIKIEEKLANDNFMNQNEEAYKLLKNHFSPWSQEQVSYSQIEAMWGLNYKLREIYLENYKKASLSWFERQEENANFEKYNTLKKKAITLKNTNVRVLPTNQPMFFKPTKPGEGFPFDYNQNSLLKINSPIIVSHLSKDKAWAYAQASSFGGWINISDIAFVDEKFISEFKTNDYFIATKEKFPLYENGFREYIKVGTIFPKKDDKYIVAKKVQNQEANISLIDIKDEEVSAFPIKYNVKNRIKIAKQLLNEPYGWGGLLNNRDCSSFTKDFFAPFGKYLQRNSKGQTKNGLYKDMSKLSNKQKKLFLMKYGVPFSTLVYLKGHIMLYVGIKDNEPLVMHNVWSVKLKDSNGDEYRHIIGKATITPLDMGRELKDFDEDKSILKKIQGLVIL